MENKDQEFVEENLNDSVNNINLEPEDMTREINLDELYDGAINNTVVIDPVTNNEVLLASKKPNFTILGIVIAILILLILYYVNNKTELGSTTKDVTPKTTKPTAIEQTNIIEKKSGVINCTYSSHSDVDTQTITYTANYKDDLIIDSVFNYVVMLNGAQTTTIIDALQSEYENFYLKNASLSGSSVTFEKTDKGFTFNVNTKYETAEFDRIIVTEGQTILYVKPNINDTYNTILDSYTKKGFTCNLSDKES